MWILLQWDSLWIGKTNHYGDDFIPISLVRELLNRHNLMHL